MACLLGYVINFLFSHRPPPHILCNFNFPSVGQFKRFHVFVATSNFTMLKSVMDVDTCVLVEHHKELHALPVSARVLPAAAGQTFSTDLILPQNLCFLTSCLLSPLLDPMIIIKYLLRSLTVPINTLLGLLFMHA